MVPAAYHIDYTTGWDLQLPRAAIIIPWTLGKRWPRTSWRSWRCRRPARRRTAQTCCRWSGPGPGRRGGRPCRCRWRKGLTQMNSSVPVVMWSDVCWMDGLDGVHWPRRLGACQSVLDQQGAGEVYHQEEDTHAQEEETQWHPGRQAGQDGCKWGRFFNEGKVLSLRTWHFDSQQIRTLYYIMLYLYLLVFGEFGGILGLGLEHHLHKTKDSGGFTGVCRTFLSAFPFPAFSWETNQKINISDQKLEEGHESRWTERRGEEWTDHEGQESVGVWLSRKRRQNFHPSVTMCQVTGCQDEATSYIIFLPSPATTSAFFSPSFLFLREKGRQFVEIN